ncbi:MAG TPA: TRAP transporter substrate-binding protein DctP [bacterium]|nr:TRAP transporter substrate-binding protein DctP [bacterium]
MRTQRNSVAVLLAFIVLLGGLAGCGPKPSTETTTQEPTAMAGIETVSEQPALTLTYASFAPPSTFPCVQMEHWKAQIETWTGGKVKVETLPAKAEVLEAVLSGRVDIGNFRISNARDRFPASEVIDLPVGFASAKAATLTFYHLLEKYNPKEFENVKIITVFTCPPCNLMTATPIRSLEELKGAEIFTDGSGNDILKCLGAAPLDMSPGSGFGTGAANGLHSSLELLKDRGYAEQFSNVTMLNLPVTAFAVVMNAEKWASLPEELKVIIDNLRLEQAIWTADYVDAHAKESLEWAKQEHNVQVFDLPAEDLAKLPELVKPVIDDYIARANTAGLPGEQIVQDVLAAKEQFK